MTISRFTDSAPSRAAQGGSILIESLIGLLVLGIVGGGILHTTARVAVAQRDMTVQTIAVSQMRNILMTGSAPAGGDICAAAPSIQLPGATAPVAVTVKGCTVKAATIAGVTINGVALAAQSVNTKPPRVLEVGTGDALIRIGGKINESI